MEYNKQKERIFEFDFLRILAVFAVIVIHVASELVMYNLPKSTEALIGNIFDSIAKFAVPFFVMISGYFVLNENYELSIEKIKDKIIKLLCLFIFWSCFYAGVYNFREFIPQFIYGHYHLWYMFMIIGLYLMTPVLRLFVSEKNRKYVYYCIFLGIIFAFLPSLLDTLFIPNKATRYFSLYGIAGGAYLTYFLIGWDFKNIEARLKNIWLLVFWVLASVILIFYCRHFLQLSYFKVNDPFYNSVKIPILIYSVSLFTLLYHLLKKFSQNINSKFKNFISKCSSLTLGVYLIHVNFLYLFIAIFKNILNGVAYVLVISLLTFITSFIVVYILSKFKYLRRLVLI